MFMKVTCFMFRLHTVLRCCLSAVRWMLLMKSWVAR